MIERIEHGDAVACDFCGDDYSNNPAIGGLLFQSKAACPVCAPRIEQGAKGHGEERFIRGRCPVGMEFRAWVREILREGMPATTTILTGEAARRALGLEDQ